MICQWDNWKHLQNMLNTMLSDVLKINFKCESVNWLERLSDWKGAGQFFSFFFLLMKHGKCSNLFSLIVVQTEASEGNMLLDHS